MRARPQLDTWEWGGTPWTQRSTLGANEVRQKGVMFGGGPHPLWGETFEWKGTAGTDSTRGS